MWCIAWRAKSRIIRNFVERTAVALERARAENVAKRHHAAVKLVECQPVFDLVLIALEDGLHVVHVVISVTLSLRLVLAYSTTFPAISQYSSGISENSC